MDRKSGSPNYHRTQRAATALYLTYFHGVPHAPHSYLTLGREIERLSRALAHLLADSTVAQRDDSAAKGVLAIALDGVYGCLVEIQDLLVGLRESRLKTERWMDFSVKIQFSGGKDKLRDLRDRVGFHCWGFELAMRTLMK
jgi:hypothetical protein